MSSQADPQGVNVQHSDQWHLNFEIPSRFSTRAEDAIASGLISKSVHTEIVQSVAAAMMVHTKTPTSLQYNVVCQKLIDKYPILKDAIGSTGYVSYGILSG